jgi:AcrR family transcriptional regulator
MAIDSATLETGVDGRRVRRHQNREAVIDAMVEMFHAGIYSPGSAQIAERAGLSPRSLFRYFDDIDDLTQAAIDRQLDAAKPLLDAGVRSSAPLHDRISSFVTARVKLHEATTPGARAARACAHRNPVVALQVRESRAFLRKQVRAVFPELAGKWAAHLPVVDALLSFETYDLMRSEQRLSSAAVTNALTSALSALLR